MLTYRSIDELVQAALACGSSIGQIVLEDQVESQAMSPEQILALMEQRLQVMRTSASEGLLSRERSPSNLSGGAAWQMQKHLDSGRSIAGPVLGSMLARALAVAEVNARMGRIVAAPTAGSCGILPAVLLTLAKQHDLSDGQLCMALLTAGGIGMVIASQATLSGAEGGCQAECGSASAMAAAAAVELMGGTPEQAAQACAIALKNVLGLVCDPVAGLVEVPCIKRNAAGAANALAAADMALAGIASAIPPDEVIGAMQRIGSQMPASLRETAEGGLAATPTGRQAAERIAALADQA